MVIDTHLTDHMPIMVNIKASKQFCKSKDTRSHSDLAAIVKELKDTDFSGIMSTTDVNHAADLLINTIRSVINNNTQIVKIPRKTRTLKPWITPGLVRCVRNRDKMHQQLRREPNNVILKTTYLRYRNFCNNLLRRLKVAYEKAELDNARTNPRKMWDVIRKISGTKCQNQPATELLKICSEPDSAVAAVNKFFANVGKRLAAKIKSQPAFSHELSVSQSQSQLNSMVILEVSENDVEKIITNLRTECATGWDGISTKVLKLSYQSLTTPITHICNLAITTGTFPDNFKKALVHPVYKAGNRDDVNNYRPISVLTSLSKILEKIINNSLVQFLEKYNIIADNQFGFRNGKSTEDAVGGLTELAVKKLDERFKCLGIFLDLSKAFDTVSVPILLAKMERIGIRGVSLDLFKNYLTDRKQCVKVGNFISNEESISYGLPQGSILAPTLFQIYVNDLCQLPIENAEIFMYADDTALLVYGSDWTQAKLQAEALLRKVMRWLNSNLLTLNVDKTNYVTFAPNSALHPPQNYFITAHTCPLTSSDCTCTTITRTTYTKYLGVYIDDNLCWEKQIESLAIKLRKLMFIFKKLRHPADFNTLRKVYMALCQSLLAYCITIWGGALKTKLLIIERAQRYLLKIMLSKPFRYPTTELYLDSKVLTVRQLYVMRCVPRKHITLLYKPLPKRRKTRVCSIVKFRTTFATRHYYISSSRLYNNISKHIDIYSLNRYECKRKLENWLLKLNYSETEDLLAVIK